MGKIRSKVGKSSKASKRDLGREGNNGRASPTPTPAKRFFYKGQSPAYIEDGGWLHFKAPFKPTVIKCFSSEAKTAGLMTEGRVSTPVIIMASSPAARTLLASALHWERIMNVSWAETGCAALFHQNKTEWVPERRASTFFGKQIQNSSKTHQNCCPPCHWLC